MTKKPRKSGRYQCLHCGGYFDDHNSITIHLWEDMVKKDNRYKEV